MAELQKLNHRHDLVMEWLVCNGDKTQRECAEVFGYTEEWLSQMIHSDMFQAGYIALCQERKVAAVHTIASKLSATASLAIDRLKEKLESGKNPSEKFVLEATNTTLERLGYSGVKTVELHNHQYFTPQELVDAGQRARIENTIEIGGGGND